MDRPIRLSPYLLYSSPGGGGGGGGTMARLYVSCGLLAGQKREGFSCFRFQTASVCFTRRGGK